jgi:hypothetical protein
MATAQDFCSICQCKVSADTILSDDALWRALDLGEISVMHVFVDQNVSSADHIWRLSSQEMLEPPQIPKFVAGLTASWCALRPVFARLETIRPSRTNPDSLHLYE